MRRENGQLTCMAEFVAFREEAVANARINLCKGIWALHALEMVDWDVVRAGLILIFLLSVPFACRYWKRKEKRLALLCKSTVVVTGGSRGIGFGLVQHFLALGCRVYSLDIEGSPITHSKFTHFYCDVSDAKQVVEAFAQIPGPINVLVNNAGTFTGKSLSCLSNEEIHRVIGTNLLALFYVTREAMKAMPLGDSECICSIVNVSSCLGLAAVARMTDYCASKSGVYAFSEALRQEMNVEWGFGGVQVMTVCPYLVLTGMFKRVRIKFPRLMPGIPTQRLVQAIFDGILHQEDELWIPGFVWGIPLLRMLPTWLFDRIQQFFGSNEALVG